jgi:hypothetical protein
VAVKFEIEDGRSQEDPTPVTLHKSLM